MNQAGASTGQHDGGMNRQEYLFQCALRNPAAQRELRKFLRKFPIFYALDEKGFSVVPEELQRWKVFLASRRRSAKIEQPDGGAILRVSPKDDQEVVKLPGLLKEISELRAQISSMLGERNVAPNFLEPIEPYENLVAQLLSSLSGANPRYFSLSQNSAGEYARKAAEFRKRWGFHPHWPGPKRPPVIIGRTSVAFVGPDVKLFIPVPDTLTLNELKSRWGEVFAFQSLAYSIKKRPQKTDYERLLEIYELRREKLPYSEIASRLSLTSSAVKTQYRRVHKDIHGLKPGERRRSGKLSQARLPRSRTVQEKRDEIPDSASSLDMLLQRASTDLRIPIEKLEQVLDDPAVLTKQEKASFQEWLLARQREQVRR